MQKDVLIEEIERFIAEYEGICKKHVIPNKFFEQLSDNDMKRVYGFVLEYYSDRGKDRVEVYNMISQNIDDRKPKELLKALFKDHSIWFTINQLYIDDPIGDIYQTIIKLLQAMLNIITEGD